MLQFWLFSIWLSDKHPACIEPLSSHRKYSYSLWRCIFDVRRNCWAFLFASYAFFQNNLLLFLYNFAQHSYSFLFGSHFTIVKSLPCIKSIFLLSSTVKDFLRAIPNKLHKILPSSFKTHFYRTWTPRLYVF